MFQQSINSPILLKSGYESFSNLGYWCHPCVLDPNGLRHILGSTREAVKNIKSINKAECSIRRDVRGEIVVVSGLDLVSEDLYDFARTTELIEVVEALLGMASISIHVKYLNRTDALIERGCWCQDHATNESHFDELALSICIPIIEYLPAIRVNEYGLMPSVKYLPHQNSDFTETSWKLDEGSVEFYTGSTVPHGGAVIHNSLAIYRPAKDCTSRELLVLNYRRSPYRQGLR